MGKNEIEQIGDLLMALSEAQERGEHQFVCPICGGTVKWDRAEGNGHIHAGCDRCGIRMCE